MARSRISWNPSQKKRLRKAVSSYNAAITRMEKSGKYDALPNRTSVEREMGLIETRDELRQRERELGRILKKNNPEADKPVDLSSNGTLVVPQYLQKEIQLAARSINKRRLSQRFQLFDDLADVSKATEYARYSNKNLMDIDEDDYYDGDDLDALWEELYPQTAKYADKFVEAWNEYNGDPLVPGVIEFMAEQYPDELALIFESGDDEVSINYIYSAEKSADKTPVVLRHDNIISYWNDIYVKYAGMSHPDYAGE